MTMLAFIKHRLAIKLPLRVERFGMGDGAGHIANITPDEKQVEIGHYGHLAATIPIARIPTDRIAGPGFANQWALTIGGLRDYRTFMEDLENPVEIASSPINPADVFRPAMNIFPDSKLCRVEHWGNKDCDDIVAFLDVAANNPTVTAMGYLLYNSGQISLFTVAPLNARLEAM